jgi:hypothetical protein
MAGISNVLPPQVPSVRSEGTQPQDKPAAAGTSAPAAPAAKPDVFVAKPAAPPLPPKPAQPLNGFIAPESLVSAEFQKWVEAQKARPSVLATHDAIAKQLMAQRPDNVAQLLVVGRACAREALEASGELKAAGAGAEHLVTQTALVALSSHAFWWRGEVREQFPRFLSDGRSLGGRGNDAEGSDKSWHAVNHALFSYAVLFDQHFGEGQTADALMKAVETFDPTNTALKLGEAYERVRGAAGGLTAGAMPVADPDPAYFARPTDLSPDEAKAYDGAVRVGDSYEHISSHHFPKYEHYDPDKLGTHPELSDPLAAVDDTREVHSGLADPGVTRDMTADRIGAYLGVQLFRDPRGTWPIPFDEGEKFKNRPLAPGAKGTFAQYLAHEGALLATLSGTGAPPPSSKAELLQRMNAAVDQLSGSDREKLSRYYANFTERQLSSGVYFGEGPKESPYFEDHQAWARTASPDDLKGELLRRVDKVEQAHGLKELQAMINERVMFDRALGHLTGGALPLHDGASQDLESPRYINSLARLIANPRSGQAYVVMNGFKMAYERNSDTVTQGRYGYDVMGLPTSDEISDGKDGVYQTFDRGWMEWNPRDDVRIHLGARP